MSVLPSLDSTVSTVALVSTTSIGGVPAIAASGSIDSAAVLSVLNSGGNGGAIRGDADGGRPAIVGSGTGGAAGVAGGASGTGANAFGVWGDAQNEDAPGVRGTSDAGDGVVGVSTGGATGVVGLAGIFASHGLFGETAVESGYAGVSGSAANSGTGVYGETSVDYLSGVGVFGQSAGGAGVYGQCEENGLGAGVWGIGAAYGVAVDTTGTGVIAVIGVGVGDGASGVHGEADYVSGDGGGVGLRSTTGADESGNAANALYGYGTTNGYGIWVDSDDADNNAYFNGGVQVTGYIWKDGGGFLIDHPQDPENKHLVHSFVESPDMKNVYDGEVTADDNGEAAIQMPPYFDVINEHVCYQLTSIGAKAPNLHVKEAMAHGRFIIGGAQPRQVVCWQVTGKRKDPVARANPISVERLKPAREKGLFRHPALYGQPPSRGLDWETKQRRPIPMAKQSKRFARPEPAISKPAAPRQFRSKK